MDYATFVTRAVCRRSMMVSAAFGFAVLIATTPAHAQAFADLKSALVDYSKADIQPRKACEDLGKFKSKEIVQIAAAAMPAATARRPIAASPV